MMAEKSGRRWRLFKSMWPQPQSLSTLMWLKVQRKFSAYYSDGVVIKELTWNRRMLAVGLESGEILVFTSARQTPSQWISALTISREYVPPVRLPNHKKLTVSLAWRT